MEQEAHKEAETDELSTEIRYYENEIQTHEDKLNEIDVIQSQLLSEEFKSNQEYDLLKRSLHRSIQEESDKLLEIYSPSQYDQISASSSENDFTSTDAQRIDLLKRTQQELDQIYSTTESIMSTSSRMSKSLSRDSQHLFLGSTEPMLRNSVHITVSDSGIAESLNASEEGTTTETGKDDSSDATEESSNAPVYTEIKRRDKPSKEVRQIQNV